MRTGYEASGVNRAADNGSVSYMFPTRSWHGEYQDLCEVDLISCTSTRQKECLCAFASGVSTTETRRDTNSSFDEPKKSLSDLLRSEEQDSPQ